MDTILSHEMLAFLRVHDDFQAFWHEHVGLGEEEKG